KKILMILFLLPLFIMCGDIDRDNALDPKNPNSKIDQLILVELFVNDSSGFDYCQHALEAIENIKSRNDYSDEICVLEYHVENAGWNDQYSLEECKSRYHEYVPLPTERGIPDAFFNGLINRVQGASPENIEHRYLSALEDLRNKESLFRFEAEKNVTGESFSLDVKIARLGGYGINDLELQVVVFEDIGTLGHRYVVRKIFHEQAIDSMNQGDVKSFSFFRDFS
ncbi:hypothetical protein B6I21_07240, partial [candidate division KSB1 bacterium 4572_119]